MKHSRRGLSVLILVALLGSFQAILGAEITTGSDLLHQLNQAFADVAQRVSASVVVINIVQKPSSFPSTEDEENGADEMPPGFWRRFHEQFKRRNPEPVMGQGSGVIIRQDGYILTNSHVVEDAESIQVRLQDGRTFKAVVHGVDAQSDLAVLKIDAQGLSSAKFADSAKTRVGEFAIAVGTPFSLDYSVTFGHVSAKGRSNVLEGFETAMMDQDFIQTDALINPGNSGGPLVNIDGEVIGINTLIQGFHTGIGFAIPSNLAKEVSDQLVERGRFVRAWLGIAIAALSADEDLRELAKGVDDGIVVTRIVADGPVAKSDLKAGDIITAVDGQRVSTPQQLRSEVRGKKVGRPIALTVFRKGANLQIQVTPGEWIQTPPVVVARTATNSPPPASQPVAGLGVTVQALTDEVAAHLGVSANEGVLVASVEKNSPAARKGLKAGDVIISVDEQPVNNPKQFNSALKRADLKKGVLLNFVSNSTPRFEIIKAQP